MADVFEGFADGGPLDGQKIANNAPKGFVLVSEDNMNAWVYDYDGNHRFECTKSETLDEEKLEQAQLDGGRSVRVLSNPEEEIEEEGELDG